jgi:hypothetical protein
MFRVDIRRWSKLAPVLMMLCLAPFIATVEVEHAEEPWPPMLVAETPADIDHDVAMLQLRANITLARLIEFGNGPE